jgi:DNA-binding NarL/FixJ family response regulator
VADDQAIAIHAVEDEIRCRGNGEIEVVGKSTRISTAIEQVKRLRPDVVVLDLQFGDFDDGLPAIPKLRKHARNGVLVLSGRSRDDHFRRKAEALGAAGFLSKDYALGDIVQAIRRIAAGCVSYAHPRPEPGPQASILSPTERGILRLCLLHPESSRSQIASAIPARNKDGPLSPATLDTHLRNIHRKLGMQTMAEILAWARIHLDVSSEPPFADRDG